MRSRADTLFCTVLQVESAPTYTGEMVVRRQLNLRSMLALLAMACLPIAGAISAEPSGITITRIDPRFDQLVPRDATLEKIADGFTWVEGPLWHKQGGYLLFSDIPANSVFKLKPG